MIINQTSLFEHLCPVPQSCLSLLRLHGLEPTRLLCSWGFSGKNTGTGYHFLLQGIFLTQRWNLCLLHWQADSLLLSHQGSASLTTQPPKLGFQGTLLTLPSTHTQLTTDTWCLLTLFIVVYCCWCLFPIYHLISSSPPSYFLWF